VIQKCVVTFARSTFVNIWILKFQLALLVKSGMATTAIRSRRTRTRTSSAAATPAWTRWQVCGVPRQATKWLSSQKLFQQPAVSIIWELNNTSLARELSTLTTHTELECLFTQVLYILISYHTVILAVADLKTIL
jgi:hypothetical protein